MNNSLGKHTLAFLVKKLKKHPDVMGVTTSRKIRGGQELTEECITIFVKDKIPKEKLSPKRKIPQYFYQRNRDGSIDRTKRLYTDVVQIGYVKPLVAGGSTIIVDGENGTLTMAFHFNSVDYILSNRHVLAPKINQRNATVQTRTDTGLVNIASLSSYFQTPEENGNTFIDAAIAKVDASNQSLIPINEIQDISSSLSIKKIRALKNRESGVFWFSGGRSGVRSGAIMDILAGGGSWKIEYDLLGEFFVDKLYALRVSAIQGDSGSPVYEKISNDVVTLVGIVVAIAQDDSTGSNFVLFHSIVDVENGFKKLLNTASFSFL
jgi:hypothetical protein